MREKRGRTRTDIVMTEADLWFLVGSASLSAAVIGFVCFLELSYRLERRCRRAAAMELAGLSAARATHDVVAQLPTTEIRHREQLRLLVWTAALKRKLYIRLPWWPVSRYVNQPRGPNSTPVYSSTAGR
jgi:hypothetical protein